MSDEALQRDSGFLDLKKNRPEICENILKLREEYKNMSDRDKQVVKLACDLVRDSDALGLMMDYKTMFPLTNQPKIPEISERGLECAMNKEYVAEADSVFSLPTKTIQFIARGFKFHYPETFQIAEDKNLYQEMKNYAIDEVRKEQTGKDPDIEAKLIEASQKIDGVITLLNKHSKEFAETYAKDSALQSDSAEKTLKRWKEDHKPERQAETGTKPINPILLDAFRLRKGPNS